MNETDRLLEKIARSWADQEPVDWATAEQTAQLTPAQLEQLRALDQVTHALRRVQHDAGPDPRRAAPLFRWGPLEVQAELGAGAQGTIYRAYDPVLAQPVALKLIRTDVENAASLTQQLQEARGLAQVRHRNVLSIYGAAEHDGRFGVWSELVDGSTLEELLGKQGPFAIDDALAIGRDLGAALAAVHAHGLIHGDVKTSNVLRERGGRIVLADFGACRGVDARAAGTISGTRHYLPPETLRGDDPGIDADVYALGVLIYRLLCGRYPYAADTADDLLSVQRGGPPVPLRRWRPDAPQELSEVLSRALAPDAAQRLSQAGDLLDALAAIARARHRSAAPMRKPWAPALALAVLAAVFVADKLVLWWHETRPEARSAPTSAPETLPQPKSEAAAFPDNSIAVLPFANESGKADEQYFSDGLSEDLITALTQFTGLKVVGVSSSFQFRNSTEDNRAIGAKLGVAHLLEGSVRRTGNVVRIRSELVNTRDGSTQWSQRYDRPYQDLFKLQDEITSAVAAELKARLRTPSGAVMQSDRPPSGSLDAYEAYLKGQQHQARDDEVDYGNAISDYERAIGIDPRYAQAFAARSLAQKSLATGYRGGGELERLLVASRNSADKAIELEPDNAMAHRALGALHLGELDWVGAEAEFSRALTLAPDDVAIQLGHSLILATLGRIEQAAAESRRTLASDALNGKAHYLFSHYALALGKGDEAERSARTAVALLPASTLANWALCAIEVRRGRADAVARIAASMPAGPGRDTVATFAAQMGVDHAAADAAMKTFVAKNETAGAFQIAEAYALRNEPEQVFQWLDRAWTNRDPAILELSFNSYLVPYRSDPRFAALLRRVGLSDATRLQPENQATN